MIFKTKAEIALDQIRAALKAGVSPGVLLADAGYGADGAFRADVTAMGLPYVVGVQSTLSVWPPDRSRCRPSPGAGGAARHRAFGATGNMRLFSAKKVAIGLPRRLAHRLVAGRLQRNLIFALRRGADTTSFARLEAGGASFARMAPHRMA